MIPFNVIDFDFNRKTFGSYDVMPYLVSAYKELRDKKYKKVPKTFEEFKKFVKDESMYQFWGRCEYEIILVDWPCQKHEEKWDVYQQIMMNHDLVTRILIENVCE